MAEASASGVLLFVCVGTLLVGTAALVVGVLTLRSARGFVGLAEERMQYLGEEQERLAFLREERRALADELERERQERRALADELERDREARLEAQRRVERAGQEARSEAARRVRARLDDYLRELEEDPWPGGMRRVK